jgi:hypothetical protein
MATINTVPWKIVFNLVDWRNYTNWPTGVQVASLSMTERPTRKEDFCIEFTTPTNPDVDLKFVCTGSNYKNFFGSPDVWVSSAPGTQPLYGQVWKVGTGYNEVNIGLGGLPTGGANPNLTLIQLHIGTRYYLNFRAIKTGKGKFTGTITVNPSVSGDPYNTTPEPPPPPPPEPPPPPPEPPPPVVPPDDDDDDPVVVEVPPPTLPPDDTVVDVPTTPTIEEEVTVESGINDKFNAGQMADAGIGSIVDELEKEVAVAIPAPYEDVESLYRTADALKTAMEQLTRQRGDKRKSAMLVKDIEQLLIELVPFLDERYGELSVAGAAKAESITDHINDTALHILDAPATGAWGRVRGTWIRVVTPGELGTAIDPSVLIKDTVVATNATWSSYKITIELDTKLGNVVEDLTPQLGGLLDINNKGFTVSLLAAVSMNYGDLCYLHTTAGMAIADATADTTATTLMGICLTQSVTAGTEALFQLSGFFTSTGYAFPIGSPLYASTIPGEFTTAVPTGSGEIVRVMGYTLATNGIYFNPDTTWLKLA